MKLTKNQKKWIVQIVEGKLNTLYAFCSSCISKTRESWERNSYYQTVELFIEYTILWDALIKENLAKEIDKIAEVEVWSVPVDISRDVSKNWNQITTNYRDKQLVATHELSDFVSGFMKFKTKEEKKNIVSNIFSIIAMFVAMFSILLGIWQTNLTRKHNLLTFQPALQMYYIEFVNGFEVQIRNEGIGPAIIDTIFIENVNKNIESVMKEIVIVDNIKIMYSNPIKYTINQGKNSSIISVNGFDPESIDKIKGTIASWPLVIKYRSPYNEFFTTKGIIKDIRF